MTPALLTRTWISPCAASAPLTAASIEAGSARSSARAAPVRRPPRSPTTTRAEGLGRSRRREDRRALGGEALRDRLADTARGAGHQGDLSVEAVHDGRSLPPASRHQSMCEIADTMRTLIPPLPAGEGRGDGRALGDGCLGRPTPASRRRPAGPGSSRRRSPSPGRRSRARPGDPVPQPSALLPSVRTTRTNRPFFVRRMPESLRTPRHRSGLARPRGHSAGTAARSAGGSGPCRGTRRCASRTRRRGAAPCATRSIHRATSSRRERSRAEIPSRAKARRPCPTARGSCRRAGCARTRGTAIRALIALDRDGAIQALVAVLSDGPIISVIRSFQVGWRPGSSMRSTPEPSALFSRRQRPSARRGRSRPPGPRPWPRSGPRS